MSWKIKLEVLCRKCIKPSTPTPAYLKIFKLSLLDQLSPNIHGNITLFYPAPATHATVSEFSTKSQLLQNSLSQMLTRFYPLAGRLLDAATIDCNDEGAFFIEAQTNTTLSHILTNPDLDTLQLFLPTTDNQILQISNASMLLVRFTLFGCGGTAVTISLTHKLADIAALVTLLKSWTAACGCGIEPVIPELAIGAALFPPRDIPGMSASVNIAADNFTARRFVFDASKVEELKSRVKRALEIRKDDEDVVFQPSRVEVVLALIWRCALSASRSKTSSFKPSALFHAVNLRPRMVPAVADTAMGNFVWAFAVTVEEESEVELHELVKKMRKAKREFVERKAEKLKEGGGFGVVMEMLKERGEVLKNKNKKKKKKKKEIVVYKCSSWCKFPLLETDFGWGKPVWMCSVNKMVSNTIALMDTTTSGVEACVTLDQQEMAFFQQDQQLLHYALLNPTVII